MLGGTLCVWGGSGIGRGGSAVVVRCFVVGGGCGSATFSNLAMNLSNCAEMSDSERSVALAAAREAARAITMAENFMVASASGEEQGTT